MSNAKIALLVSSFCGTMFGANALIVGTLVSDPTDAQTGVKVEKGRQGIRVRMRWVNDFGMDVGGGNFPISVASASVSLSINGTPQACSNGTINPAGNACGFVAAPFNSGGAIDTVKIYYNGNFPASASVVATVLGVKGFDGTTQDPSNNTITFAAGTNTARPTASIETVFDISGSMASPAVSGGAVTRMDTLKHAAQALYFLLADHAMLGDKSGLVFFSTTASGGALQAAHDPTVTSGQNGSVQGQAPTNSTSIGAGLSQAASAGLGADSNQSKFVLLFSDGEQNTAPNVGFSGTGNLQVGGSDYLANVRVCPITAGQLTAPGFALQQQIAHSRCDDQNLHVQDGAQQLADADFLGFFTQALTSAIVGDKLEITQTASNTLATGATRTETWLGNSKDVAVSIILSWTGGSDDEGGPRLIPFRITAPNGTVIDTTGATRIGFRMAVTTLRFPMKQNGIAIDPKGQWKIDLLSNANMPAAQYNLIVVNDNATIASNARINVQDPGTGEPIPIRVTLTEGGAPLTGATVTGLLAGPQAGLGDALARAANPTGNPSQAGDPVGSAAKAKLLLLLQDPAFRALLVNQPLPDVVLTESSPGVYTGTFNGATKEGHYQFIIRSLGSTASNGSFQRLQRVSVFVRPKPDSGHTDLLILSKTPQPDGSVIVRIKATPRDRFGSMIGPDYQPDIAINSSIGSVSTPLSDTLDGSYQIDYKLPSVSSNPTITLTVMGTNVKHCSMNSCGTNGGADENDKWVASFHIGGTFMHSPLSSSYGSSVSVGGDLEYRFTHIFSAETFVGYDRFTAKFTGPDFWFTHLSEYAKLTFGTGPLRPFVDAGLGVYFDTGAAHFGGGFGLGMQYWPKRKVALEGSYNFHAVQGSSGTAKYSTALLGVRYSF